MHLQAISRLASIYLSDKNYIHAASCYSKLVALDSTNGYYWGQMAFCCSKMGITPPVISFYHKALHYNPNSIETAKLLVNCRLRIALCLNCFSSFRQNREKAVSSHVRSRQRSGAMLHPESRKYQTLTRSKS